MDEELKRALGIGASWFGDYWYGIVEFNIPLDTV